MMWSPILREGVSILKVTAHDLDLLSSSRCNVMERSGAVAVAVAGRGKIGRCDFPGNNWRARVLLSAEIGRWIEAFLEFNIIMAHSRRRVGRRVWCADRTGRQILLIYRIKFANLP